MTRRGLEYRLKLLKGLPINGLRRKDAAIITAAGIMKINVVEYTGNIVTIELAQKFFKIVYSSADAKSFRIGSVSFQSPHHL